MNLNNLLEKITHKKNETFNPKISFISCNSNKIKQNTLFVCLKGINFDGHDFAKKAILNGAVAVVVEKDLKLENQILVKNTHKAFGIIAANFYNNPAEKLKFIGVTGTNGKTSVSKIIKDILTKQGKKVGLISTINIEIEDEIFPTNNTTPTHLEFQRLLKKMVEHCCEYVVMEVSSHALLQQRIANTQFEIAIFTNLTQDHLDYHKTMENYFNAKKLLFKRCKKAIICTDDEYGELLFKNVKCEKISFAINNKTANFLAKNIKINYDGIQYKIENKKIKENITFTTPGTFSVYNSMAAFICCILIGIEPGFVATNLKSCSFIKGRSERIETNSNFTVICDYAHSPDGLQNILNSIKNYKKTRIITLFGCGGDRDKTKRPLMGEIAAKNSNFLILTSDNPRTEDPKKIIDDIIIGVKKTKTPYVKIPNRKKAIYYAIKNAKKDDIILLAGKGHETYQIVGDAKFELDERKIVKDALEEATNNKKTTN